MNFSLLLPTALTALAALLLPLIIHLARRSEQHITDFAALRWLSIKLRPRRKIIFQEILLLLLRLFLLTVLALFLAKPVSVHTPASAHWVLVTPGVDLATVQNLGLEKSSEWHWLTPGFPDYAAAMTASGVSISSLLRELDAQLPENTRITVIVPEQLSGLDGERIRLSRKVEWKVVTGKMPEASPEKTLPVALAIRFDDAHADSVVYFRAAHAAWLLDADKKSILDVADASRAITSNHNTLLWLASGELPQSVRDWIGKGNTLMAAKDTALSEMKTAVPVWRNQQGTALLHGMAFGEGRILQWQQALKPSAMPELLDADFPMQLQSHLQTMPRSPTQALARSHTPSKENIVWPKAPQSLQVWLALLIALLFMLERWMASSARRWSAA